MSRLTANEHWVIEFNKGSMIWAQGWGDSGDKWWWPVVFVELECGLIKIDVCGLTENWSLDDCARLRIENDQIIDSDNFYDQQGND